MRRKKNIVFGLCLIGCIVLLSSTNFLHLEISCLSQYPPDQNRNGQEKSNQNFFQRDSNRSWKVELPRKEPSNPSQKDSNPSQKDSNPSQKDSNPSQKDSNPFQKDSSPSQEDSNPSHTEICQPLEPRSNGTQPTRDFNLLSESLEHLTQKILKNGRFREDADLLPTCRKEQRNFVYIKNHKCGSDTMSAVFRRFGYERNLSMVLPVRRHYNIGWPFRLSENFYRPAKHGRFNILCEHTLYNKTYFDGIMQRDSVYITSIRDPFSRMKSAFFFFGVEKISNLSFVSNDPNKILELFLEDPQLYDTRFKAPKPRVPRPCVPDGVSVLRNAMSFDLGFPVGYQEGTVDEQLNLTYIHHWLEDTDRTFDIVLLLDHFHESLVMLKRMMCWTYKDILFKNFSTRNPKSKKVTSSFPSSLVDGYHLWSFVDYVLYQHFRNVFFRRICAMGSADFLQEVEDFKQVLAKTLDFCDEDTGAREEIRFPGSKWNPEFVLTRRDCALISSEMRKEVKEQYDADPVQVEQPKKGLQKGC